VNLTGAWLGSDSADSDGAQQDPGNPFDQVADLDTMSAELSHRAETLECEYRDATEALDALSEKVTAARGTGTAEDRAVEVTVDGTGRVCAVHLDPRALRLGSIGRLEAAIVTAAATAADDLARRLDAELGDPVHDLYAAMPELAALLGPRSDDPFGARTAEAHTDDEATAPRRREQEDAPWS